MIPLVNVHARENLFHVYAEAGVTSVQLLSASVHQNGVVCLGIFTRRCTQ